MSDPILWAMAGTYTLGWYLAAPKLVREIGSSSPRCHYPFAPGRRRNPATCRYSHGDRCWNSEPTPTWSRVLRGTLGALAWPLLLIGWDVWRRSKGKRSYTELQHDIAALEREAGL